MLGRLNFEQTFDVLRRFCKDNGPVSVSSDLVASIEGTGAWKTLTVASRETGEVITEKKFYKADFGDVWNDHEYGQYVNAIFNAAHADIMGSQEAIDVNDESYEEVRQIAMSIEEDLS